MKKVLCIIICACLIFISCAFSEPNSQISKISLIEAEKIIGISEINEITSNEIWKNIGLQIFSYNKDGINNYYFIKNRELVNLTDFFGMAVNKNIKGASNIDIDSMCVSDINGNGIPEMLYTYTFGSGLNITTFKAYENGKLLTADFGSIKFCRFKFIKKDNKKVELGVWCPNIQESSKKAVPIGSVYISDNTLKIKLFSDIPTELRNYISSSKASGLNTDDKKPVSVNDKHNNINKNSVKIGEYAAEPYRLTSSFMPILTIEDNNRFKLELGINKSVEGKYKLVSDRMILTSSNRNEIYIFSISKDALVINQEINGYVKKKSCFKLLK